MNVSPAFQALHSVKLRVPVTLTISNDFDGLGCANSVHSHMLLDTAFSFSLARLLISSDDAATSLKETSYLSDRGLACLLYVRDSA